MCYALADDLIGLRRVLPELAAMAARHHGWRPLLLLAEAELERIRGRLDAALAGYDAVLAIATPGRHMIWPFAAGLRASLLVDLGRAEEAEQRRAGRGRRMRARRDGRARGVHAARAGACAQSRSANTRSRSPASKAERGTTRAGHSGIPPGSPTRCARASQSRWATPKRSPAAVAAFRAHCAVAPESLFAGHVARLYAAARAAGIERVGFGLASAQAAASRACVQRLRHELSACPDVQSRAERALELLMEVTRAQIGHLFGVQNGVLAPLATCGASAHDAQLRAPSPTTLTGSPWRRPEHRDRRTRRHARAGDAARRGRAAVRAVRDRRRRRFRPDHRGDRAGVATRRPHRRARSARRDRRRVARRAGTSACSPWCAELQHV